MMAKGFAKPRQEVAFSSCGYKAAERCYLYVVLRYSHMESNEMCIIEAHQEGPPFPPLFLIVLLLWSLRCSAHNLVQRRLYCSLSAITRLQIVVAKGFAKPRQAFAFSSCGEKAAERSYLYVVLRYTHMHMRSDKHFVNYVLW